MDQVEKYFNRHREAFDTLRAGPENWQKIAQRLDVPSPAAAPFSWRRYRLAASILLLLALGSLFYIYHNKPAEKAVLNLAVDDYFPDIQLRAPDGKPVPISTLKGKKVLVEFWASYSKVCTDQHCYYFKPLYEEYKDKGFEIYAISVDSSAMDWISAISEDQLNWVQVSDLEGRNSPLATHFDLDRLPLTFLLDEDGKIIARDIDAEDLKDQLSQLFAAN